MDRKSKVNAKKGRQRLPHKRDDKMVQVGGEDRKEIMVHVSCVNVIVVIVVETGLGTGRWL